MERLKSILLLIIALCLISIVGVSNFVAVVGYIFLGTVIVIIVLGAITWLLDTLSSKRF